MPYHYSPSKNACFLSELRAVYEQKGAWPSDAIEIDQELYDEVVTNRPPTKVMVPDVDGFPMLADPPSVPWSPDPIKNQVRAAREIVLNRLTGLRQDAADSDDTATVNACKAARLALLNITTDPRVTAATDDATLTEAFRGAYGDIVAAAGQNLVNAFAGFNL